MNALGSDLPLQNHSILFAENSGKSVTKPSWGGGGVGGLCRKHQNWAKNPKHISTRKRSLQFLFSASTGTDCINYIGEVSNFKLLSLQVVLEDIIFKSIYRFFFQKHFEQVPH